jgi:TonB family protein
MGSFWIHAIALLALVRGMAGAAALNGTAGGIGAPVAAELALEPEWPEPEWIDVRSVDEIAPMPPRAPNRPPEVQVAGAAQGENDRDLDRSRAPRIADGHQDRAPAPDSGGEAGRTEQQSAWRRDRSTLHARLTDGATLSQPARRLTSSRSTSPEAVRREPVVGAGDAIRTEDPRSARSTPNLAASEPSPRGDSAPSVAGTRAGEPLVARPEHPLVAERASEARGVGPIEVEAGPRSFDSQRAGAAADDKDQRAASNEPRPGITDFSHSGVASSVDALSGRGPGQAPGAVDRAAAGSAPAEYGSPNRQDAARQVAERSQDRRYDRYMQEIQRRVNNASEFPKRLALRLEQGETIVRFVLQTDGRVTSGVQVLKSSGFDEFDDAAARAVQRAAPFPPMPASLSARPRWFSVRVAFENPLVR